MDNTEPQLAIQNDGDVTIVSFLDRNILDEGNIQSISEEITTIIEKMGVPKLLISFEDVEHLSSAALGALITISNRVRQRDGQLCLSDINPQIFEVFKITKLDKLFQIYKTTAEARKKFK